MSRSGSPLGGASVAVSVGAAVAVSVGCLGGRLGRGLRRLRAWPSASGSALGRRRGLRARRRRRPRPGSPARSRRSPRAARARRGRSAAGAPLRRRGLAARCAGRRDPCGAAVPRRPRSRPARLEQPPRRLGRRRLARERALERVDELARARPAVAGILGESAFEHRVNRAGQLRRPRRRPAAAGPRRARGPARRSARPRTGASPVKQLVGHDGERVAVATRRSRPRPSACSGER